MKKVYYVGLDTHKESIAIAIAQEAGEVRAYGQIGGTLDALDKAIKKIEKPDVELRFVYEAGPCGYVICRHLVKRGFQCIVVSPSLVPKKASDRVKTDQRDAENLARLFRAGELTPIYIPGEEEGGGPMTRGLTERNKAVQGHRTPRRWRVHQAH